MKQNEQNFFYVLSFFIRNSKKIIGFCFVSAILAGLLTFFINPLYTSHAITFPTSGSSMEYTIDNPNFGYDIEADRLLQIFQSTELSDSLCRKFHLASYYRLDTTKTEWKDLLYNRIKKDLKFERTRSMSIEISATTKDPVMSADIVNYALSFVNKIRDRIYKTNIVAITKVLKGEYTSQKSRSDSLLFLISQKDKLGQAFLLSQDKDGRYNIVINQPKDIILAQLMNQYIFEQNRTNEINHKYNNAKSQVSRSIPSVYILDKATPSYLKISPSYLKNIGIAFAGTFLLCSVVLYLKEEINILASKD